MSKNSCENIFCILDSINSEKFESLLLQNRCFKSHKNFTLLTSCPKWNETKYSLHFLQDIILQMHQILEQVLGMKI